MSKNSMKGSGKASKKKAIKNLRNRIVAMEAERARLRARNIALSFQVASITAKFAVMELVAEKAEAMAAEIALAREDTALAESVSVTLARVVSAQSELLALVLGKDD